MAFYITKLLITSLLILAISEIAKRSSYMAALLTSIPLISILSMLWLYIETKDIEKVSALASGVFWLVLPSLALFIALPLLLKTGLNFYISITLSISITVVCYWIMITTLSYFDIKL